MPRKTVNGRLVESMVPQVAEDALDSILDRALQIQHSVIVDYVDRLRSQPGATPLSVLKALEKRYVTSVTTIGAASGAAAALPGFGTAAVVASAMAEVAVIVEATALFTLAVAEVYGYRYDDPETRRALVLSVVLGDLGEPAIESATVVGAHWAPLLSRSVNRDGLGAVNTVLLRKFVTHYGARQGLLAVGRALPFGIGATIGGVGNLALARASVRAAKHAFGRPPKDLGPRVINA
jgi:hypothetical protein